MSFIRANARASAGAGLDGSGERIGVGESRVGCIGGVGGLGGDVDHRDDIGGERRGGGGGPGLAAIVVVGRKRPIIFILDGVPVGEDALAGAGVLARDVGEDDFGHFTTLGKEVGLVSVGVGGRPGQHVELVARPAGQRVSHAQLISWDDF